MKPLLNLIIAGACLALASCHQRHEVEADYNVIPLPQEITLNPEKGSFHLTASTAIIYPSSQPELLNEANHLQGYIENLTGLKLAIKQAEPADNAINLSATLANDNPEAYKLTVEPQRIDIDGASAAGLFYGIQTLRKAIPPSHQSNVTFPAVVITDSPLFAYRGAHFDVCRHFFPADSVKSFIDLLALHNINRFHWHLSDDQGWRIEIKSRPRLTEVASSRPGTIVGHSTDVFDSIPVEGYFTQDQIRDIVDYAASRHITIIPEIDLPGHMLAALTAYPHLGCTGGPYEVWRQWGVSPQVLCAGNDSTYAFIDDVLGEVADLFPGEYFHIGGDECPKTEWEKCPKCQAKIKELGIKANSHSTSEQQLQSHVMKHAGDFLASKGKKVIGWDEMLEGGLAPGDVVMSWRGEEGGIAAAKLGHDVIMTPNTYLYFDYYQTLDQDNEPEAIGNHIPLERVYSYQPVTDAFTPEEAAHIIGVQANLWTEYIPTFAQAIYMELPRMAALSEVQWSNQPKDYDAFLDRLPAIMAHYKHNGYPYSLRAFDIKSTVDIDPANRAVVFNLATTPNDDPIYYTLDGTEPGTGSPLYTEPVALTGNGTFKAVSMHRSGPSYIYADSVKFHKATARHITLAKKPAPKYASNGGATLVDGRRGGPRFSSDRWVGFNGVDLDAVIDLGQVDTISTVGTRTNVSTGSWVFDARDMSVELSTDSVDWTPAAAESFPALEKPTTAIFDHNLRFTPTPARYVRLRMSPEKSIPDWHTAAKGRRGYIFVDEIVVE